MTSPVSSHLAGLAGRLTDPQDREAYARLLSYFDSLPPDDEMFRLARLLGLLTLLGQRIPEAAASLTAEMRTQADAASACYKLLDERLDRLVGEITEVIDASTIARAMTESVRQAAGKELLDVGNLAGQVAQDLRLLSRAARVATMETSAECAKLTQLMLDLMVTTEATAKRNRQQKNTAHWLVFLSGFLFGVLALIWYHGFVR
jgi:NTP pyrophosphatase (non-canonical NTP hydrolase)